MNWANRAKSSGAATSSATVSAAEPDEWTRAGGDRPAVWPLTALVIGDTTSPELGRVAAEIREQTVALTAADLEGALRQIIEEGFAPDCIFLLENRPGELSRELLDALCAGAPLARLVCVLGSWCEGEYRSGRPWPAAPRVYWHQFHAWFRRELAAIERGDTPALLLPITATEEERLLQGLLCSSNETAPDSVLLRTVRQRTASLRTVPQRIAIHSPSREMRELLNEACANFGHETSVLPPLPQHPEGTRGRGEGGAGAGHPSTDIRIPDRNPFPTTILWDFASTDPRDVAAFAAAIAQFPAARWITLAGFPRENVRVEILRLGAAEVLSKPLVLDQLREAILGAATRDKHGQRLLFD